jgi:hypothetical protein
VVTARVGDRVEAGEVVAELHYNGGDHDVAAQLLSRAFVIGTEPVAPPPLIHEVFESQVPAERAAPESPVRQAALRSTHVEISLPEI